MKNSNKQSKKNKNKKKKQKAEIIICKNFSVIKKPY